VGTVRSRHSGCPLAIQAVPTIITILRQFLIQINALAATTVDLRGKENMTTSAIDPSIIPNTKPSQRSTGFHLGTIFSMVFLEFLIMGISIAVLPVFIHTTLHLGNHWVGIIIGAQYITTLATRQFAGRTADHSGGRRSVIIGIAVTSFSGIFLLLAANTPGFAVNIPGLRFLSVSLLLAARILLGTGESFLIVGIFTWGFAIVGPARTGKVMVWNGMGMYAGMACGAPAGIFLQSHFGSTVLFAIAAALPALIYVIMILLPAIPLPKAVTRMPFYKAVGLVWTSGVALALASISFSGIASFISLYFIQQHWQNGSFALTAFGVCYIAVRLIFSDAPDKFGGAKVALICLVIEVAGQTLIWSGISGILTIAGAAVTGAGMSLIFPSLGQLAIKKVEPSNRGMAIAAYNAFFDLGMGLTAPLAGLLAGRSHYDHVYLFGAAAAMISAIFVLRERAP